VPLHWRLWLAGSLAIIGAVVCFLTKGPPARFQMSIESCDLKGLHRTAVVSEPNVEL
jgi:hypothetical protein